MEVFGFKAGLMGLLNVLLGTQVLPLDSISSRALMWFERIIILSLYARAGRLLLNSFSAKVNIHDLLGWWHWQVVSVSYGCVEQMFRPGTGA